MRLDYSVSVCPDCFFWSAIAVDGVAGKGGLAFSIGERHTNSTIVQIDFLIILYFYVRHFILYNVHYFISSFNGLQRYKRKYEYDKHLICQMLSRWFNHEKHLCIFAYCFSGGVIFKVQMIMYASILFFPWSAEI